MRHVVIGICISLVGLVVLAVIAGLLYSTAPDHSATPDSSKPSHLPILLFIFGGLVCSACLTYGFMVATNLASLPRFATKK